MLLCYIIEDSSLISEGPLVSLLNSGESILCVKKNDSESHHEKALGEGVILEGVTLI